MRDRQGVLGLWCRCWFFKEIVLSDARFVLSALCSIGRLREEEVEGGPCKGFIFLILFFFFAFVVT